jgi:hypothetical protein
MEVATFMPEFAVLPQSLNSHSRAITNDLLNNFPLVRLETLNADIKGSQFIPIPQFETP